MPRKLDYQRAAALDRARTDNSLQPQPVWESSRSIAERERRQRQQFVAEHGLRCASCGRADGEWTAIGRKDGRPWAVCSRCRSVTKIKKAKPKPKPAVRAKLSRAPNLSREREMINFVAEHDLACFKCGRRDQPWHKVGTSRRGPWAVCRRCTNLFARRARGESTRSDEDGGSSRKRQPKFRVRTKLPFEATIVTPRRRYVVEVGPVGMRFLRSL